MLALSVVWLLGAAPSIEQCVQDSEAGQVSRLQSKLRDARARFEACSQPACPAAVRSACTQWLSEVLDATPTVIVGARLSGGDVPAARATLDGQPWLASLSGTPEALDPGEHVIGVEHEGARAEQRLVVNASEKDRLVVLTLVRPPAAVVLPSPVVPAVLSGVAFVGAVLFAGLGSAGRGAQARLVTMPCAATMMCSPGSVDAVKRLYVAADVALAIGIVAAGFAAWRWWVLFG